MLVTMSACQPRGFLIENESQSTVDITIEDGGRVLVPEMPPSSKIGVMLPTIDDQGCATNLTLLATTKEGKVVAKISDPCPGSWVVK